MSNSLDYKTVYLLVPGSMVFSTIDSGGRFTLVEMAEGAYPVRFFTLLDDWEPKDTMLAVVSGVDTLLTDSIELKFKGVPVPQGFIVRYDTLRETAVLKWDPLDTSLIDGINIYRAIKGENFKLLTEVVLPETTTIYFDNLDRFMDGSGEYYHFEYRVVAYNRSGEESRMVDIEADTVVAVEGWQAATRLFWSTPETFS